LVTCFSFPVHVSCTIGADEARPLNPSHPLLRHRPTHALVRRNGRPAPACLLPPPRLTPLRHVRSGAGPGNLLQRPARMDRAIALPAVSPWHARAFVVGARTHRRKRADTHPPHRLASVGRAPCCSCQPFLPEPLGSRPSSTFLRLSNLARAIAHSSLALLSLRSPTRE